MALLVRSNKTSIWSDAGTVNLKRFKSAHDCEALTIKVQSDNKDTMTHSITLYGKELDELVELLKKG